MLTSEEEKFFKYWKENRLKQKSLRKQLSFGVPLGFLIGGGVLFNFVTGWYSRATMVANSQSTPFVLLMAVIIITLFCSVFYKRHKWEMNEQRYIELKQKQNNYVEVMQQEKDLNSQ